jgi:uncharacterized RDD family membrane protein YckC
MLSSWGYTPGKWLLGVQVLDRNEAKLNADTAFSRSLDTWCRGFACGIPIIAFVAASMFERRLRSNGTAAWDERLNLVVRHKPINPLCAIVVILFLLGIILLSVLGSA